MDAYKRNQVVEYTCPVCGREFTYTFMDFAVPPSFRICPDCMAERAARRAEREEIYFKSAEGYNK